LGGSRFALCELLLLAAAAGCRQPQARPHRPLATRAVSLPSALALAVAPRAASRFACQGGTCRQQQPRLPDTGEWRCAESKHVVWCAGGEPAAGVVGGPPDRHFRCGPRWGTGAGERVCIERQPDYPGDPSLSYQCRFEQEQGVARVCRSTDAKVDAKAGGDLAERALPACWLDRDCPSGTCDRGACRCAAPGDCQTGRCANGLCLEASP